MVFHVTPFGPSCCEIQYTDPDIIKEEADAGDADDNEIRGTRAMSSFSFDYCFFGEVTASNQEEDKLVSQISNLTPYLLNKQCQEIILVKRGNSWTASLRFSESTTCTTSKRLEKLRLDNEIVIGDLFVFNVVGDDKTTPLMCVCPERKECSELLTKHLSERMLTLLLAHG
ncbi:hypothetical protein Bca52824_067831 [Brassica carinata]|uniref:Uncharacterized protein n=1 Tax=Brassica carinata TaxID=52824 RepID=A0A8X7UEN9_BRACI|nr:hypothetical protein Bca52824_067831 [Brassica carinata]